MTQDELKKAAAKAAMQYVVEDAVVGVGTGSTVNYFIDELAAIKHRIDGAVATSTETIKRLKAVGIPVFDLNAVDVPVYVDGADEFNDHFQLIKGGGGALTREKILASVAKKFVCIADVSKQVKLLGKEFPVAIEVIPMARSYVARELVKLKADPVYRENTVTDNNNSLICQWSLSTSTHI